MSDASPSPDESQSLSVENSYPVTLGLRKSIGFGDRLGLAGPGHLAALAGSDFAPVLAQQSIRELERTGRTLDEVIRAAREAVAQCGYRGAWGADADHLKTPDDVQTASTSGFTCFTIDPSDSVVDRAGAFSDGRLTAEIERQGQEGIYGCESLRDLYLGRRIDLEDGFTLAFDERSLLVARVKYGRAIHRACEMAATIRDCNPGRRVEIELSVDETSSPTSALEHYFIAAELKRRGVEVVSLAPRFVGDFEKGIDYRGDVGAFEESLRWHVAIAHHLGPYKISVHSGSDKFAVYPVLGRVCGDLLHVKTAGTSYLEALRVVCRRATDLFRGIAALSLGRFAVDRGSYHVSVTEGFINGAARMPMDAATLEHTFLNHPEGRQVLHVTFGSVLSTVRTEQGQSFREGILETLRENDALHHGLVAEHLGKHVRLLSSG